MKENNATLSRFFEIGRHIRRRMAHIVPLSLSAGQIELMCFLAERDTLSMREIARHFDITAPSATSLVDELVRGGYVSRAMNARDRREVRVSLTKKGAQATKKIAVQRMKVLEELFSSLSAADRRDLNRILDAILTNKK